MTNSKIDKLQNIIKIQFKDQEILKQSLIHKSFSSKKNNEKLEFLGDRVLGLILSKKLLEIFPNDKEGIIDKKFANLVNKKTCLAIGQNINLKEFMILGGSYKGHSRSDEKIISDCLEALIGAVFIDRGLEISEQFILNLWNEYLKKSDITKIDSKTKLQEFCLKKFKELPKYKSFKESGPQHSPIFKVEVKIPNSKTINATGGSKQKAQQNAAFKLIKDLKI